MGARQGVAAAEGTLSAAVLPLLRPGWLIGDAIRAGNSDSAPGINSCKQGCSKHLAALLASEVPEHQGRG